MTITQARKVRSLAIQARIVNEVEVANFEAQAHNSIPAYDNPRDVRNYLGKVDVFIAEKILDKARKLQREEEIS